MKSKQHSTELPGLFGASNTNPVLLLACAVETRGFHIWTANLVDKDAEEAAAAHFGCGPSQPGQHVERGAASPFDKPEDLATSIHIRNRSYGYCELDVENVVAVPLYRGIKSTHN
ncbi:hypothetical protein SCARD494_02683 [Seiridium cardinale]